jgi:uncharacterized protein (TIGR02246 family)
MLAATAYAQSRGTPEDEAAIKDIIENLDVTSGPSQFAVDADWTNAFGVRLHGREEIARFFDKLHQDPNFMAGKTVSGSHEMDVRFVRPDAAVVHNFHDREGQIDSATGKAMRTRKIHTQYVLSKEQGKWLIQSELIMDERL